MSTESSVATQEKIDFILTASAIKKITQLMREQNPKIFRIRVKSGGCSGFQYDFLSENQAVKPDDLTLKSDDFTLVIDPKSFVFLKGSQLNYVREMIGSYFAVENPNAKSSCGCGVSFSVI